MSDVAPSTHDIQLTGNDCAVVFQTDGTLNVFVPSREEGEAVPAQMLYALLVQEMLKDQFMMKVLTDRIVAQGLVGTKKETPAESTEESAPAEEGAENA